MAYTATKSEQLVTTEMDSIDIKYIREQIRSAYVLMEEADEIKAKSAELQKKSEELNQQGCEMWLQSHNTIMEMNGYLPGNDRILFKHAVELKYGKWGPSDYVKAIELFLKLIDKKSEYFESSAFHLAGMYLKGKINNNHKNREDRKNNLSNSKRADRFADMFKTNEDLTNKYLKKKEKFLHN